MGESSKERREALREVIFGGSMPVLWCPPLTHYTDEGEIDFVRMAKHLNKMSQWVRGYLVPGSTSDGWELNKEETRRLLEYYLEMAQTLGIQLLIGVLRTDTAAAAEGIEESMTWLGERTGEQHTLGIMKKTNVCGFAVCGPKGKEKSQEEIYRGLREVLELGVPTALYQLPQVTENEMSAETVGSLAEEFGNFYLFKDSSGSDKAAVSGIDFGGVFMLRGAEGDYWKWQKSNGGPYDGFLLGSANCFAEELSSMIRDIEIGDLEKARALSEKVSCMVKEVSEAVKDFPGGNAFTNANKVMDHFFAYGESAINIEPPLTHSGIRLTKEFIETAGDALRRNGLMRSKGYMSQEGD
jgi:dihydrodipicolinate synthase/N-acetylneuraminate lyase